MKDRNEWFEEVERAYSKLKIKPNTLSVRCPVCGMYESVIWGGMDLPPFGRAVRELAKRWGGRCL